MTKNCSKTNSFGNQIKFIFLFFFFCFYWKRKGNNSNLIIKSLDFFISLQTFSVFLEKEKKAKEKPQPQGKHLAKKNQKKNAAQIKIFI